MEKNQQRSWLMYVEGSDFIASNRELTYDNIFDPWEMAGAFRPLSYFEAVYDRDEVALFWSAVAGGAATGMFIGTSLGAGTSTAFGGYGAYSMMMRYHPITIGAIYAPYYSTKKQFQIGQELDERYPGSGASSSVSMKYSRSNPGSGGSMPVVMSQNTDDPSGGLRDGLRQMFGLD